MKYVYCAFLSLSLSVLIIPIVIKIAKRLKAGQPILGYVDNHYSKAGTPTFGGIGFVIALTISVLVFCLGKNSSMALMCLVVTVAYCLVGFLDDFIKAKGKRNEGLKPLQKIFFQSFIAIIISCYAYVNVGDKLLLPFSLKSLSLGYFSIPFNFFVFLSFTNAVNLTDGLDGLASSSAIMYLIGFITLLALVLQNTNLIGIKAEEVSFLIVFSVALAFVLIGFLFYNCYPAKIFMGDTGSLAIGGAISSLAIFSGLSLYAPIMGIVFVISCLSDVIQVAYFKKTRKRIFLMAPFHHHLERKGMHENKIVSLYCAITLFFCFASIILTVVIA